MSTAVSPSTVIPPHRGFIIITVMMLAILEVLDSTIVNVALPHMMATLGANRHQITWVLTSYIVASAIILPLTGFLVTRLGQKRLLLICSSGFMLSSLCCGLANSLDQMVVFRILQGMFGSPLIPISQAILRTTYPPEQQPKAMAIWGLGIMAAPVLGPTLGGLIVNYASWHWIFYLNLPICIGGFMMVLAFILETPRKRQEIDYLGLTLMVIGVSSVQIFLDKGNENSWFESNTITLLAVISIFCLSWFIIRSLWHRQPLIRFAIYRNRNFSLCSLAFLCYCASIFSLLTLVPQLLQGFFNYTAQLSGLTVMPIGLFSACGMIIGAIVIKKKIPVKYLLLLSLIISSIASYRYTHITLQTDPHFFLITNALLGFGMGCFMVPITTYSLATLSKQYITEAAGLYSYARMLGTSIGISLISTAVSRSAQAAWHQFTHYINPFSPRLQYWLSSQHYNHLNNEGLLKLSITLQQQAALQSFLTGFKIISVLFIVTIPLILLLKNVNLEKS